jgi:metal-responsive CopG/Arc/MetJ family transcriptional regulator
VTAIRLSKQLLQRIDEWSQKQSPPLSRSEAIRELLERGFKARKA